MKGFWNDDNGFSESDFEKIILGISFLITVAAIIFRFCMFGTSDPNIVYYSLGIGSLFVVRKGLSYFKPNQYYANVYGEGENTNETIKKLENQISAEQVQ